jgi:hypothetical protein
MTEYLYTGFIKFDNMEDKNLIQNNKSFYNKLQGN